MIELKEARIIFQNSMAHATRIAIHNSQGKEVKVDDVVAIAKLIATEVVKIGNK